MAMPSASGEVRRRIVDAAQQAKVPVKTLPSLYELISGDVDLGRQIRPVQVEDVLGREQVEVDFQEVASYLEERRPCSSPVPAARSAPSYAVRSRASGRRASSSSTTPRARSSRSSSELKGRDFTAAVPQLVDVKERAVMKREVFEKYRPTVVFHAAAYKHVAMLETHPLASVRNNVVGTRVCADARRGIRCRALRPHLDRQGRQSGRR